MAGGGERRVWSDPIKSQESSDLTLVFVETSESVSENMHQCVKSFRVTVRDNCERAQCISDFGDERRHLVVGFTPARGCTMNHSHRTLVYNKWSTNQLTVAVFKPQ